MASREHAVKLKVLLLGFLLLLAVVPIASASPDNWGFQIGVDAIMRQMAAKKGSGSEQLAKKYLEGNIHGGFLVSDYWGFDFGYQSTTNKKRSQTFEGRSEVFSINYNTLGDSVVINTKSSIRGGHGSLVVFVPLSEGYRLKLIASAGLAQLQFKAYAIGTYEDGVKVIDLAFNKKAWVPKLSVGLQYMMSEHLGARVLLGWEGTARFKKIAAYNYQNAVPYFASLKSSMNAGCGLFYKF